MSTVLIDTDVAIDYLRGIQYAKQLLVPLWEKTKAFLSILSVYELFAGMQTKEIEATHYFVGACQIEGIDLVTTEEAAKYYQHHRKEGITLATVDCLVYATAKLKGHKIATRNIRHYPEHRILVTSFLNS